MDETELLTQWKEGPKGGTSECFFNKKDPDVILKLYHESFPRKNALIEYKQARFAKEICGIKTPGAHDIITVGNRIGIIFDRVSNGNTLANEFAKHPEKIKEYCGIFHREIGKFSYGKKPPEELPSLRDLLKENIKTVWKTKFMQKRLFKFLDEINECEPDDVYIHGDLHPGNLIISGDECVWIDIGDLSRGPISLGVCTMDIMWNFPITFLFTPNVYGLKYKNCHRFFRLLVAKMIGTDNQKSLDNARAFFRKCSLLYMNYIIIKEHWRGFSKFMMKFFMIIMSYSPRIIRSKHERLRF